MLGYTQSNNDVYIFFENDEIERLSKGKIQGIYFNLQHLPKRGLLEAVINDEIQEQVTALKSENDEGFMVNLLLEMRSRVYQALRRDKFHELHEGFRHICLRDASKLSFPDQLNYNQLKHWESQ